MNITTWAARRQTARARAAKVGVVRTLHLGALALVILFLVVWQLHGLLLALLLVSLFGIAYRFEATVMGRGEKR